MNASNKTLFNPDIIREAIVKSFIKLNPAHLVRNPVMFTVWISTVMMVAVCVWIALDPNAGQGSLGYNIAITVLLFFTIWIK